MREVLKQIRRRKAPGPDEIPMELFKEMQAEGLEELRETLNLWWREENIEGEDLRARVALILKKGDSNKFESFLS